MQSQRRTDTSFACSVVGKRELENRQKGHRDRVKNMTSMIDTKPPPPQSHLTLYGRDYVAKKRASTEASFSDLKMIQTIARTMTRTQGTPIRKGPVSLNADARKQEVNRIVRENSRLLNRLETMKPAVALTSDLVRDHRWKQRYKVNASHTSRLSGELDNELMRFRAEEQAHMAALHRSYEKRGLAKTGEDRLCRSMPTLEAAGTSPNSPSQPKSSGTPSAHQTAGAGIDSSKAPDLELVQAAARLDAEHVSILLAAGANPCIVHKPSGSWGSNSSKTALHAAIEAKPTGSSSAAYQDGMKNWKVVLGSLLTAKADVNAKRCEYDWRGCGTTRTAFGMLFDSIVEMQDSELLDACMAAGANPNATFVRQVHSLRTDGQSTHHILNQAVQHGDIELASILLNAGAQADSTEVENFVNEDGYHKHKQEASLHVACTSGYLTMAALLLARGAQVDAVRVDTEHEARGVSSPTNASRGDDCVPRVRCIKVEETALHIAAKTNHAELAALLLCAGANPKNKQIRGDAQHTVAELCSNDERIVKLLSQDWSADSGSLLPDAVKSGVETVLAIAQRYDWSVPNLSLFQRCDAKVPQTQTVSLEKETTAPLMEETIAPLMKETTVPLMEETTSPSMKETTSPSMKETTAPSMKETTAPLMKETSDEYTYHRLVKAPEDHLPTGTPSAFSH